MLLKLDPSLSFSCPSDFKHTASVTLEDNTSSLIFADLTSFMLDKIHRQILYQTLLWCYCSTNESGLDIMKNMFLRKGLLSALMFQYSEHDYHSNSNTKISLPYMLLLSVHFNIYCFANCWTTIIYFGCKYHVYLSSSFYIKCVCSLAF